MKKVCNVCGYVVENIKIRECPNCGSYGLNEVRPESGRSNRFRLGRLKR